MADNSQQIADSLKGINSSLETFTNLSKQMEERLSDIADSSSGIRDDYGAIEKHQEKIVKETKNWGGAFKGVVESAGKVASFVGSAVMVTGLADAFRTTLKLDQSMKNLSARMGLGVENAKKLYNTVTDVASWRSTTSRRCSLAVFPWVNTPAIMSNTTPSGSVCAVL